VAHVVATVRARVSRLLACRQVEPADDHTAADPLTETSPVLAGLVTRSHEEDRARPGGCGSDSERAGAPAQ